MGNAIRQSGGGGKRNPAEAFGEVAKIIFVKIWDEKHLTKRSEHYSFQRKSDEPVEKVKQRIVSIYSEAQRHDSEVFKEDIKLNAEEVTAVVEHLQAISLSRTDLDVKGEAFQRFMGSFFKGDFGQYFTPTPIVKFCIQLFRDELNNHHKVLDPACGSGGFLLQALDYIREQANGEFNSDDPKEATQHFAFWHNFAEHNLFGIEINEAIARVAKMNMILHDDGHTNVIGHDALDDIEKMWIKNHEFEKEKFDFIFTNPPFGANVQGSEHPYIQNYELAKNEKKQRDNQKSEILFLERCYDFLKPSTGKIAIVLPDGVLTNSSLQYVRDFIIEKFEILAVVSLPQFAFSHFGAGVKSSLVFLRKKKINEKMNNYPIFMAIAEHVGYDATGRTDEQNDLTGQNSIEEEYALYKKNPAKYKRIESCFTVAIETVVSDGPINPLRYTSSPNFTSPVGELSRIADVIYEPVNPSNKNNKNSTFGLIRIDDLETNPTFVKTIRYGEGSSFNGNFQRVQCGDVLIARLGPSLLNKKIIVCPEAKDKCDTIASNEFIVLRPKDARESYFICGMCRTNLMVQYLFSKSRGATPSRYRLIREDILQIPFPIVEKEKRLKFAKSFEAALHKHDDLVDEAKAVFDNAHNSIEKAL